MMTNLRFALGRAFALAVALLVGVQAFGQPTPFPPASQAEVDAGTVRTKFVSPLTLRGYAGGPTNGVTAQVVSNIVNSLTTNGPTVWNLTNRGSVTFQDTTGLEMMRMTFSIGEFNPMAWTKEGSTNSLTYDPDNGVLSVRELAAVKLQASASYGTPGQVLTSTGDAIAWGDSSAAAVSSLSNYLSAAELPQSPTWNAWAMPIPRIAWSTWNSASNYYYDPGTTNLYGTRFITNELAKLVNNGYVARGVIDTMFIDDGWQLTNRINGRMMWNTNTFPEGLPWLARHLHTNGVKLAAWITYSDTTNSWDKGVSSYGYLEQDVYDLASWGLDGVIIDEIFSTTPPNGSAGYTNYNTYRQMIREKTAFAAAGIQRAYDARTNWINLPGTWTNHVGLATTKSNAFTLGIYSSIPWEFELGYANEYGIPSYGAQAAVVPSYGTDPGAATRQLQSIWETALFYRERHPNPGSYPLLCSFNWNNGQTYGQGTTNFMSMSAVLGGTWYTGTPNIDGSQVLHTNAEITAIFKDPWVKVPTLVTNNGSLKVWKKPLATGKTALFYWNQNTNTSLSVTCNVASTVGTALANIRNPWAYANTASNVVQQIETVAANEMRLYVITPVPDSQPLVVVLGVETPVVTNSSTMANSALSVGLGVGEYMVEIYAVVNSSGYATAGSKAAGYFTGTTTTARGSMFRAAVGNSTPLNNGATYAGEYGLTDILSGANHSLIYNWTGRMVVTVPGTLTLQAAQASAVASQTVSLGAGSYIRATRK